MPFVPHTPEADAVLTDASRGPALCHGISNDGKPCNRALQRSTSGQPASGIITIVNRREAFFCARHQDQAQDVVLRHTASFARRRQLVGRGSMDTLIEKVELLVAGDTPTAPTTITTTVSTTKKVAPHKDPFKALSEDDDDEDDDASTGLIKPPSPPTSHQRQQKHQQPEKKHSHVGRFFSSLCCVPENDDDDQPVHDHNEKRKEAELRAAAAGVVDPNTSKVPPKARRKSNNSHVAFESVPPTPPLPMMQPSRKTAPTAMLKPVPVPSAAGTLGGKGMSPATPATPNDDEDVPGIDLSKLTKEQQALMKLVPTNIASKSQRRLQQELLKPFSDKDEPGYIYIFWLTDSPISPDPSPGGTPSKTSDSRPGSSYLHPNAHPRTHSSSLMRSATKAEGTHTPGGGTPKILLKIGRANNVQRRLHEWQNQCGYNLALIRYYPHTSATSPAPTPDSTLARMVPYVHRVEHLIHLELAENNPRRQCKACGKLHLEWFEVDASRAGVESVNETVKRWVDYGERMALGLPPLIPSQPQQAQGRSRPSSSTAVTAGTGKPAVAAAAPQQSKTPAAAATRPKPDRHNAAAAGTVKMYDTKPQAQLKPPQAQSAVQSRGKSRSPARSPARAPKQQQQPPKSPARSPARAPKQQQAQQQKSPPKPKKSPAAAGTKPKKSPRRRKSSDSDDSWGEDDYSPSD